MKNRDIYFKDPTTLQILNQGVAKVSEISQDSEEERTRRVQTLRFELETFVCDGEYAKGMVRILDAYLKGLNGAEQKAVWVSGFFGSGKSHLVKVLRYLWEDYRFEDGATARSLVHLPMDVTDLLTELSTRSKALGGLRAAAGTLGAGDMGNVRLAFIQLILRAAGLPENIAQARFILWLHEQHFDKPVSKFLTEKGKSLAKEVASLNLSTFLAEALVAADPKLGTPANAQAAIRTQFKDNSSPTIADALDFVRRIFGNGTQLPCTLLVVDEIQQFIGQNIQRANDLQEIAEHCSTDVNNRLLFVGTGQSALASTPALQRLQARFTVRVQLSDSDVEGVIRKTILRKKPEHELAIRQCMDANHGEMARHLQNSRLAFTPADEVHFVADYPLLPTRRRFWEKVLRNTDQSGTKAQLRSQLQIVFEATKRTAEEGLGSVVPADFIYDQVATDLLNSGQLEREYDETIRKQRDKTPEGELRSSLCALAFLIGKLPQTAGSDEGVRATADTLIDLLVGNLQSDRLRLEQSVPAQLEKLVAGGQLMVVENEYHLQTREGAIWTHDFNRLRTSVLNDDSRINEKRAELLREAARTVLRPLSLQQGASRQPRRLSVELTSSRPQASTEDVTLWIRDGWSDDEKTVVNDARAAGVNSPMLFGYLPRLSHEDLRLAIASNIAAQETLDSHGAATTPEAIQARKAIETHLELSSQRISELIRRIVAEAKVILGGGRDANGLELTDKVRDAATNALERLFEQFGDADHGNWGQVVAKAKGGDVGALAQVGHTGDVVTHPVCRRILDLIAAGKKGKDIRDEFRGAPYGWPQDAIDGALLVLTVAGNLRATLNNQPVQAQGIPQNQIGIASFYVDVPPLNVAQRLDLKALFQKADVKTPSAKESEAAGQFLDTLLKLAESAGGEAPKPEVPDKAFIRELQTLSGNAQLLRIHGQKDDLTKKIEHWKKAAATLGTRWPAWERLQTVHRLGSSLAEASTVGTSIAAMVANRSLLSEPDPVPELAKQLTSALRLALSGVQDRLESAFTEGHAKLAASSLWGQLSEDQTKSLSATHQLPTSGRDSSSNEAEIILALQSRSLTDRHNLVDAIPQRFARALADASRLLEPKAQRVVLPGATVKSPEDLEAWIQDVRGLVEEKLQEGPVIL
jgi:hypothetical protein